MHDNVEISLNGDTFDCFSILFTIENTEDGQVFTLTGEFEEDTMVYKNARAYSQLSGDFNGDYNNDFAVGEFTTLVVNCNVAAGTVTKNPAKSLYIKDEYVLLTFNTANGKVFDGWDIQGNSGGSVTTSNPLNLKMTEDKIVTVLYH